MADDQNPDLPQDQPEPGATEETPAAEAEQALEPVAEDAPASEEPAAAEEPAEAPEEAPAAEPRKEKKRGKDKDDAKADDAVVPGANLEPDLVLEDRREDAEEDGLARYDEDDATPATDDDAPAEDAPIAITPLELAADARYQATGKRKTAVARVILKPGTGQYTINGRTLEDAFPRVTLQKTARDALAATGNDSRMDVVARIHGGGVASQASALRHGIARALVEADPNLRGELKRRGFLTRDPRVKERKKAGLKKARKRPQFSKR